MKNFFFLLFLFSHSTDNFYDINDCWLIYRIMNNEKRQAIFVSHISISTPFNTAPNFESKAIMWRNWNIVPFGSNIHDVWVALIQLSSTNLACAAYLSLKSNLISHFKKETFAKHDHRDRVHQTNPKIIATMLCRTHIYIQFK